MGNQQLCNLTNNQKQVLLTGKLGDGHLTTPKNSNSNSYYTTNCKYKEYIEYKQQLLGDLAFNVSSSINMGYKANNIYTLTTKRRPAITDIKFLNIEETLKQIDKLGVALWFYDDGSLHKDKYFYNLNTHKFDKDIQEELFIPFFNKLNIYPKITKEVKKDGRIFYYLRISKYEGSYEISKILEKYPINCYDYKLWSSETIQKWSKIQVCLKSKGISASNKKMGELLKCNNDIQDIVRSLEKSRAGIFPA